MTLAIDAFADAWAQLGPPSMSQIKARVAAAHGLTVAALESPSRERPVAWARQEAMWRCRQVRRSDGGPRFGFLQIGRAFGNRDHSTVLFACRAHERRSEPAFPSPNGEGRPRSGQGGECPQAPRNNDTDRSQARGHSPPGLRPPSPLGEGPSGLSGEVR